MEIFNPKLRPQSLTAHLFRRPAAAFLTTLAALLLNCGALLALQIDFQYIDLPVFKTGETGPLLGRVVVKLPRTDQSVEARASLVLEGERPAGGGATERTVEAGTKQILYPGVSTALDFPIRLNGTVKETTQFPAFMRLEVGPDLVLTQKVTIVVREYGMFYRTYRSSLDDAIYPYALYLPRGFNSSPGKKWPLVVSLHGATSNHGNNLRRLFGFDNRLDESDEMAQNSLPIWPELPDMPGIVVSMWGRGSFSYHGPGAQDVLEVLDLMRNEYAVDPERTSLTGLSMGGNGTWEFALRYPATWAAAFPVCGSTEIRRSGPRSSLPQDLKNYPYLVKAIEQNQLINVVSNARGMKVHLFHGNDDPTVPVAHSEKMVEALKAVGVTAPFTRYDNVGHNSWGPAYKDRKVLQELFDTRREHPLRQIDFTTCRYKNSRCDWLEVAEFQKYGDYAVVRASWDPASRLVSIDAADNVSLLTLYTGQLQADQPGKIKVVFHGSAREYTSDSQGRVVLAVKGGKIGAGVLPEQKLHKRGDLEGPLYDAISSRVILVFGTRNGGGKSKEEALNFCWWGDLSDVHFMVRPDTAVSEKDIAESNLLLFGDEETNRLIARMNDRLPVRFQGDKIVAGKESFPRSEVAFKYVYPNPLNPQRLVFLNFADEWSYTGGIRSFKLLPDYFIYRRGAKSAFAGEVLKAGFFDKNWQW
jgi:poly(3-hydroxybutyrate) depolymerase